MKRETASKIGGLTAWHRDPDGKREDSRKGGNKVLELYGKQHFVRMRARQTDLRRQRRDGETA